MSLAALGLTTREERVYRSLLARRPADLAELATRLGLDPRSCERALETLEQHHLLEADRSASLGRRVRLPSLALAELAQRCAERVGEDLIRIARTQAEFVALDELALDTPRPTAQVRSGAEAVEIVRGEQQVRHRIERLARETSDTLDTRTEPPRSTVWKDGAPTVGRTVRRGVRVRWLLHVDALRSEGYQAQVATVVAAGGQVRTTVRAHARLLVADGTTALVPDDAADPAGGLLVVHHPVLVARLRDEFEATWRTGTPVRLEGDRIAIATPTAEASELELLAALAAYPTDDLAARALAVSVRQLQRRVTAAFGRLGAVNRFHAGVLSARLGLVDAPPADGR